MKSRHADSHWVGHRGKCFAIAMFGQHLHGFGGSLALPSVTQTDLKFKRIHCLHREAADSVLCDVCALFHSDTLDWSCSSTLRAESPPRSKSRVFCSITVLYSIPRARPMWRTGPVQSQYKLQLKVCQHVLDLCIRFLRQFVFSLSRIHLS